MSAAIYCACCCEITGTFSVVSGTANVAVDPITATGPAEILYSGAPAAFTNPIYLCVTVRTDDDPASFRIRFNRTDASNYQFVEVAVDSGTVTAQFGKVVGGTARYIGDSVEVAADLTVNTTICLCFEPGDAQTPTAEQQGRYPTQADDEGGGWTDPTNIFNDDGLAATSAISSDTDTDALLAWGWTFLIPPGSTITGIVFGAGVEYEADDGTVIDQSMTYTTATEGPSDQLAEGNTVPDAGSNGSQQWGDTADLSGLTPTWEEINDNSSTGFVFRMIWRGSGITGSSPLSVDWVLCTVDYTTPPYEPATVYLYIGGTCVIFNTLPYIGTGTGVALAAITGDWEWSDFTLRYSESDARPSCDPCPNCGILVPPCECCDQDFPPADEYVVDLTAFALGTGTEDDNCECASIDGEYTVSAIGACEWAYFGTLNCDLDGTPAVADYAIRLSLVSDGAGGCKWRAWIGLGAGGTVQDPSDPDNDLSALFYAIYESASIADDESCDDMPVTLSKVIDSLDAQSSACSGTIPDNITIDSA